MDKIKFIKGFKCANFDILYPVMYDAGKVVSIIEDKSEFNPEINISKESAKIAIELEKAIEIEVDEDIDNNETPETPNETDIPELTEEQNAEILALPKNTSYSKIFKQYGVTKDYVKELRKK